MPPISRICIQPVRLPDPKREWAAHVAVLTAPMDHDVCFRDAGYAYFGDSDEQWDRDFSDLLRLAMGHVHGAGEIRLAEALEGEEGPVTDPYEALLLAATEDHVVPAVLFGGSPPQRRVVTGDGHQALWFSFTDALEVDGLRRRLEDRWQVEEIALALEHLFPIKEM